MLDAALWVLLTVLVGGLLWAHRNDRRGVEWVLKPLAALTFVSSAACEPDEDYVPAGRGLQPPAYEPAASAPAPETPAAAAGGRRSASSSGDPGAAPSLGYAPAPAEAPAPAVVLEASGDLVLNGLAMRSVRTHETESDVKMRAGETTTVGGYQFRFVGATPVQGPNYAAMQGHVEVTRGGSPVTTLTPEKRVYRVQRNPMTEAAIDSNLARDLYVSLGEPLEDGSWTLRVQHKPMVIWIWLGCLIMASGGALAASDRRYRRRAEAAQPASLTQGAAA